MKVKVAIEFILDVDEELVWTDKVGNFVHQMARDAVRDTPEIKWTGDWVYIPDFVPEFKTGVLFWN